MVSRRLEGTLGGSQSTAPVLEEPIGAAFAIYNLDFTSEGRGVDQGGQENESDGESTAENHCVEKDGERGRRVPNGVHQLLIWLGVAADRGQMIPLRHLGRFVANP